MWQFSSKKLLQLTGEYLNEILVTFHILNEIYHMQFTFAEYANRSVAEKKEETKHFKKVSLCFPVVYLINRRTQL